MRVMVQAPAKLNLTLDVTGRRPDGYHELCSIMQAVDRCDTLTAEPAQDIRLDTVGSAPCPPEQNIAYRAAERFFAHTGIAGGVHMTLHKHIPQQAGMGGGSADGAAALLALDALYGTALPPEQLYASGLSLGADVPFCLLGGTALAAGVGEKLTPLPALPDCVIAVAQPEQGVSTAEAYARLDAAPVAGHPALSPALEALQRGDLAGLCRQMGNVFEPALALPQVRAIREQMAAFSPLCSQMTGSGSAVFALFPPQAVAQAERCVAALAQCCPVAFLCRPCGAPVVSVEKTV